MDEGFVVGTERPVAPNGDAFTSAVVRYGAAFLETGLRGNSVPLHQVSGQYEAGLQRRVLLSRYAQLQKNLYKNTVAGFAQETVVIGQNKYIASLDERTHETFVRGIEQIDSKDSGRLITALAASLRIQPRAQWRETVASVVRAQLVGPLLPLEDATAGSDLAPAVSDIASYATERAVTGLMLALDSYNGEALLEDYLRSGFGASSLKALLRECVDDLQATDAYQEVYRLHRTVSTQQRRELYQYFGFISYGAYEFPLFYTQLATEHAYPAMNVTFGRTIHVNVAALDFVLAEYERSSYAQQQAPFSSARTITVDPRDRTKVFDQLQKVINTVTSVFQLDPISLDTTSVQRLTNGAVTLDTRLEIAAYDAPSEAIWADYDQLADPSSKAYTALQPLLQRLVMTTPTRIVQEVAEEWKQKSVAEKLAVTGPLLLDDEQKQTLLALGKKESDIIVVEGATGSGKSQLISGIVADAWQQGHSTLVLSDLSDARADVQQRLTGVLAGVRPDNNFHKPLLRLDKLDTDYLDELDGDFRQRVRAYQDAFAARAGDLRGSKTQKIQEATESLQHLMQAAENINLHEIAQAVDNEPRFASNNWVLDEPIDELLSELPKFHQAVQYIRGSESNYLLPYIEASQQKVIGEFITVLREYERTNKSVYERLPTFIVRFRKLLPKQRSELQTDLSFIHSNYRPFLKTLGEDAVTARLDISDNTNFHVAHEQAQITYKLIEVSKEVAPLFKGSAQHRKELVTELLGYKAAPETIVSALDNYIEQVMTLKSKLFGFSGRTLVVENLTRQLRKSLPEFALPEPEKRLEDMQLMIDVLEQAMRELAKRGLDTKAWREVCHALITEPTRLRELQKMLVALGKPAEFDFMAKHRVHEADNLLANISLLQFATELNDLFKANPNLSTLFGVKNIGQVLSRPQDYTGRFNKLANDLDDVKQLDGAKQTIKTFIKLYPALARRLGVGYVRGTLDIINDSFASSKIDDVKEYLALKKKEQDITNYFAALGDDTFTRVSEDLRQIHALQLSYGLDAKLLQYLDRSGDEFRTVRNQLRTGQRPDTGAFERLLKAFPCVIGDIYTYARTVPLKAELFDIVVIDDASRLNIALVLPSLLRAKKIVIVGDSAQPIARSMEQVDAAANALFRHQLRLALGDVLSGMPADVKNTYVERLEQHMDVTQSIMPLAKAVSSSEVTLRKQLHAPQELTQYLGERAYAGTMQPLRARAAPLTETIQIDVLKDKALGGGFFTNLAEAKHIVAQLHAMKELGYEGSIGIIALYPQQAALIQKEIDESVINDWFQARNLRVMTFATSQGVVRDYVFYSLVSSSNADLSRYISADGQPANATRLGRALTAALSVPNITAHFVLSQPVEAFGGDLLGVLRAYQAQINVTDPVKPTGSTDILLPAQKHIPQQLRATKFYNKHGDKAHLLPFNTGEFLRHLIPNYRHPAFKADFLLAFGDRHVIVTFDEFKEHFLSGLRSKETAAYLSADEIYAQKQLEALGYGFIRLNKFNLGHKPADVLDAMIAEALRVSTWARDNGYLKKL